MRGFLVSLCLASAYSQEYFAESGLRLIRDELSKVNLQGNSRNEGMASGLLTSTEVLLDSISGPEPDPATFNSTIDSAVTLLDQFLADLAKGKTDTQQGLDAYYADIVNCSDPNLLAQREYEKTNIVDVAMNNHSQCRINQSQYHLDTQLACEGPVSNIQQSLAGDMSQFEKCYYPNNYFFNDVDEVDKWVDGFMAIKTAFNNLAQHVETLINQNCIDKATELWESIEECDHYQSTFETHYCSWATKVNLDCLTDEECYDGAVETYKAESAMMANDSEQRMAAARIATYVRCLLQEYKDTRQTASIQVLNATCWPRSQNVDNTPYNNTVGLPPQPLPYCHRIDFLPSHPVWNFVTYENELLLVPSVDIPILNICQYNSTQPESEDQSCPTKFYNDLHLKMGSTQCACRSLWNASEPERMDELLELARQRYYNEHHSQTGGSEYSYPCVAFATHGTQLDFSADMAGQVDVIYYNVSV